MPQPRPSIFQVRSAAEEGRTLPFTTLAIGFKSGIEAPKSLVIKTQSEWDNLWKKISSSLELTIPMPSVNFSQNMVIAVFKGETNLDWLPSVAEYFIEIKQIEKRNERLVVRFAKKEPSSSSFGRPPILATPFHLIKVENSSLPVEFEEMEER